MVGSTTMPGAGAARISRVSTAGIGSYADSRAKFGGVAAVVADQKIAVIPEGRPGVWLADKASLKAWIISKQFDRIHNFIQGGSMLIGADHEPASVLKDIDAANRVAVLTGDAFQRNMRHALALIMPVDSWLPERLEAYDIGELTESDLLVGPSG